MLYDTSLCYRWLKNQGGRLGTVITLQAKQTPHERPESAPLMHTAAAGPVHLPKAHLNDVVLRGSEHHFLDNPLAN